MPKKKITIIDYGCGNILNLSRAIQFLGYNTQITSDEKVIQKSSNVILPGVGAFGNAMQKLKKKKLNKIIKEYADLKKPLLGICLGMQILFTKSSEFGEHKGLGLIEGKVIKISNKGNNQIKIPHMGWNELRSKKPNSVTECKILNKSIIGKNFYFVHSFLCFPKKKDIINAVCNYSGISIPAIISSNNIFGCQFHPEKSAESGLIVLKNFCKI